MAYPVVAATATDGEGYGSTSSTISIPSPSNGDLLIMQIMTGDHGSQTNYSLSGWDEIAYDFLSGGATSMNVLVRKSDGTDGATVSVARPNACTLAVVTFRIAAADWYGGTATSAVEADVVAFFGGNDPNPPSLTASWGSATNLFIAGYGSRVTSSQTITFPTNYTDNQTTAHSPGTYGRSILSSRDYTSASDDPSAYTNGGNGGMASTIVVRPSGSSAGGGKILTLGVG